MCVNILVYITILGRFFEDHWYLFLVTTLTLSNSMALDLFFALNLYPVKISRPDMNSFLPSDFFQETGENRFPCSYYFLYLHVN